MNDTPTQLDQWVAAGQWPAILQFCEAAVQAGADRVDIWNLLGVSQRHLGNPAAALAAYRRALTLAPKFAPAWQNLGNLYRHQGRFDDALAAYMKALDADATPASLDAVGETLHHLGRLDDALRYFDDALKLAPDFADARWDRALTRLHAEDWVGGFADYEARWDRQQPPRPQLPYPAWNGQATGTLFIHTEQGFGDTIQFMRFVQAASARVDRIVLATFPELHPLLHVGPNVTLIARGTSPANADAHCSLMSLPFLLQLPGCDLPGPPGGIAAPDAEVLRWKDLLGPGEGKRIGLIWSGNPNVKNDWLRSPGLDAVLPLIDACPSVQFVVLQQGPGRRGLARTAARANLRDPGVFTNFGETAGLMTALDGVISSDTSTAHLAGALACPLAVLVPHVADWRWGLQGSASSWYPSARIYRQPSFFDWPGAVAALAADINNHRIFNA